MCFQLSYYQKRLVVLKATGHNFAIAKIGSCPSIFICTAIKRIIIVVKSLIWSSNICCRVKSLKLGHILFLCVRFFFFSGKLDRFFHLSRNGKNTHNLITMSTITLMRDWVCRSSCLALICVHPSVWLLHRDRLVWILRLFPPRWWTLFPNNMEKNMRKSKRKKTETIIQTNYISILGRKSTKQYQTIERRKKRRK